MKELSEVLDTKEEGIPNMHAHSIEYILNRGYCICGERFEKDDAHYKALLEEMKKLPPQSIGTSISNFNKELVTTRKSIPNLGLTVFVILTCEGSGVVARK